MQERYLLCINETLKEGAAILMTCDEGRKSPENVKALVLQALDADKAVDIEIIDLRGQSALADFMVVASGTSSRHIFSRL